MGIRENVIETLERVKIAANGRDVTLIAATKMNDTAKVKEAISAGIEVCGENRVQELVAKKEENAYEGAGLHFIGHLQKNKVKYVVGEVDLIHSVDSVELMEVISKRAEKLSIVQDILIEINVADEDSKHGINSTNLDNILQAAGDMKGIKVRGLMSIPPISQKKGDNIVYFNEMRELFIDIGAKKYDNVIMDFLSMGMSGDFEDAISCGANLVRVGTAIFGARIY